MKSVIALLTVVIVGVLVAVQPAQALTQFKKSFTDKYAAKHESDSFKEAVKTANCNVCHIKGKGAKKSVRNRYGEELAKLIEGDAQHRLEHAKEDGGAAGQKEELAKILKELDGAMKKVEEMKPSEDDPHTYGELIKEGMLPIDPDKARADFEKEMKEKGIDLDKVEEEK